MEDTGDRVLEEPNHPAGTDPLTSFSTFERSIINNFRLAGIEGKRSADFMVEQQIHVGYGSTWYPNWFSAWWDARERRVMLHKRNFDAKTPNPNDPFLLNTVAHELDHISITYQYGKSFIPAGLTKYGEIRGWKTGYLVQYHFTKRTPKSGSSIDKLIHLDIEAPDIIVQGSLIIKSYLKNVPSGRVYSFLYSFLPAYPRKFQKSPR